MHKKNSRRIDGRSPTQHRPIRFTRRFTQHAPGSVLIECGRTVVLCTATWANEVPDWRKGGGGWLTAEYEMLPGSTHKRRPRNRTKVDGRTQEIQRLIGRSLRAVIDFERLGERTIFVDCDVLQADGGTRTASVTGAFVAVADCLADCRSQGIIEDDPLKDRVAAMSIGRVAGSVLIDLCYEEDVNAEVDMNVVMTGSGRLVEIQSTGEKDTFSAAEHLSMLDAARRSIRKVLQLQKQTLASPPAQADRLAPRKSS